MERKMFLFLLLISFAVGGHAQADSSRQEIARLVQQVIQPLNDAKDMLEQLTIRLSLDSDAQTKVNELGAEHLVRGRRGVVIALVGDYGDPEKVRYRHHSILGILGAPMLKVNGQRFSLGRNSVFNPKAANLRLITVCVEKDSYYINYYLRLGAGGVYQ